MTANNYSSSGLGACGRHLFKIKQNDLSLQEKQLTVFVGNQNDEI